MARRVSSFVQKYAWGKAGDESIVANLKSAGDKSFYVSQDETYAEMWIGTHPSGPSYLMNTAGSIGPLLKDLITSDPSTLGDIAGEGDLPFLFKVISIHKALSIQAHPDKNLAEVLNTERPDVYEDDNHKPEMAVTLSDFEALCGFRPFQEIVWSLRQYPELRAVVSHEALKQMLVAGDDQEKQRVALKVLFSSYIKGDERTFAKRLRELVTRLSWAVASGALGGDEGMKLVDDSESESEDEQGGDDESLGEKTELVEEMFASHFRSGSMSSEAMEKRLKEESADVVRVMLRLSTEYPGDLGVMMPLLLNLLRLEPGQAFFMTVDEPHAYLRGDILECMACSNNVVRCALTPKYRDVDLLVDMLTYNMSPPPVIRAVEVDECRRRFTPPTSEFEIENIQVPANFVYQMSPMPVPAVLVALKGAKGGMIIDDASGKEMGAAQGGVFFIPANAKCCMIACKDSPLHLAMAHTNLNWNPLVVSQGGSTTTVPPDS